MHYHDLRKMIKDNSKDNSDEKEHPITSPISELQE